MRYPIAAFCLMALAASARSIEIDAGTTRVRGYLVRDDGKKLVIRVFTDGKDKDREFDRAAVKIVHQLDVKRLEKLDKDHPRDYRSYADELALKSTDPEAKDTAIRLYVIAAYLDPEHLGRSCLVSMSGLASTPAEARKYRAMAYLLDPKSDPSILKVETPKGPKDPKDKIAPADNALKDFQHALRLFRSGFVTEAKSYAERKGVKEYFSLAPGLTDYKTFLQLYTDAGANSAAMERAIIRAELWSIDLMTGAVPANPPANAPGNSDTGWGAALTSKQLTPAPVLRLETLTEFDPRKCHFRNNAWVAP